MESNKNKFTTAGAIIVAGVIIAGAILYTGKNTPSSNQPAGVANPTAGTQPTQPSGDSANQAANQNILKVNQGEHVLGSPDAAVTLILYSDIVCPYCRQFHRTMQQAMNEYGKNGQLKWVYRHFPIESLHPTAEKEAEATECAAELGGNDKFWQYLDELNTNDVATANDLTAELTSLAKKLGLNETNFKTCLTSGKYAQKITASIQEAAQAGARGTPFGILVGPKGNTQIPGAVPYAQLKQMIDAMLKS